MTDYCTVFQYAFGQTKVLYIFPLFLMFVIGLGLRFLFKRIDIKKYSFLLSQFYLFISYLIIGVSGIMLIVFIVGIPKILKEEKNLKQIIKTQSYKQVTGQVENYKITRSANTEYESFSVDSVQFKYSDTFEIEGFHQTALNGGPIDHNELHVRAYYINRDNMNVILKLDIECKDVKR